MSPSNIIIVWKNVEDIWKIYCKWFSFTIKKVLEIMRNCPKAENYPKNPKLPEMYVELRPNKTTFAGTFITKKSPHWVLLYFEHLHWYRSSFRSGDTIEKLGRLLEKDSCYTEGEIADSLYVASTTVSKHFKCTKND